MSASLVLALTLLAANAQAVGAVGTSSASSTPSSPACTVDPNLDPFGGWLTQLMRTLCASSDADALVSAFAIALPGPGSHGEADRALLERARRADPSNIKVLWAASLIESGETSLSPDECKPVWAAADKLVQMDGDNAIAWMANARVAVQCGDAGNAQRALERAGKSAHAHDIGFDVIRLIAAETARVPVLSSPAMAIGGRVPSADEVRWQAINPAIELLSENLAQWVRSGCGAPPTDATPASYRDACRAASRALAKADSRVLLIGDAVAAAPLIESARGVPSYGTAPIAAADATALLAALAQASSERDFYAKAAKRLNTAHSQH